MEEGSRNALLEVVDNGKKEESLDVIADENSANERSHKVDMDIQGIEESFPRQQMVRSGEDPSWRLQEL